MIRHPRTRLSRTSRDRELRDGEGALRRLGDLGLLEIGTSRALHLHRLLARFAATLGADPEAAGAVEATLLEEAFRINRAGFPTALRAWQVHLRHVAAEAQARGSALAGSLWNELRYYLRHAEVYAQAKIAYDTGLGVVEASLGPDHPTANRVNDVGFILRDLGDLKGARVAFERALRIAEATLGPDHPEAATAVNNLGNVLRALGDLQGARAAFARALRIDEAVLGPDHPNVAIRLNNLGRVLQDLGDLHDARAAYERALRIFEAALGPDHSNTQRVRRNLAALGQEP